MKYANCSISNIFSEENIRAAIDNLSAKKDSSGDDGIWLRDLPDYWSKNKDKIIWLIKTEKYIPRIVHEKVIVAPNGKHRKISLLSSVDRLIQRAILQIMQEDAEREFSENAFAYRKGRGMQEAVRCAAEYIESGREYVIEIDLKDFFDSIEHKRLFKLLQERINEECLYILLQKYIACRVESDYKLCQKERGIIQGGPLSPLLSNLYLTELDRWMEREKLSFIRFADNINIYVEQLEEGYEILERLEQKIREYSLEIHPSKKGVFSVYNRSYLGYVFERTENSIFVKKRQRNKRYVSSKWHNSAIEKMEQTYYIVNDGILTKKDYTALFENEEKKVYIPVGTTDSINIYSNIELTGSFLELLARHNLNLNVFNKYGIYVGSFYMEHQRNRMKCLIKQVQIYGDDRKRLEYAKTMDMASIHNLRCNLRYYNKHGTTKTLTDGIEALSDGIRKMNEASDVNALLLIEARCRQKYYGCFNEMIRDNAFVFHQRTKRPPGDAINALISFGNVYLYQKIAQMIYKTSLDIRISFVHSALKRYENLNLDIADIFKPIIIDRVIFTVINKKMISAEKHFERQNNGVYLNQEGKEIFFAELAHKMKQIITVSKKQYTYERVLYQEVRNLEKSILEDAKYKAFKYQM